MKMDSNPPQETYPTHCVDIEPKSTQALLPPSGDCNSNQMPICTKEDNENSHNNNKDQTENHDSQGGSLSRQHSSQSNESAPGIRSSISTKRGKKLSFTIVNYKSTDIEDCPPTPLSSPSVRISLPSPDKLHPDDNQLEPKLSGISAPELLPKRRVSFLKDSKLDTVNESLSLTKKLALVDLLKRGRLFAKRKQKRLVLKNGEVNFSNYNVDKRTWSYFLDIFTTLLDLKWRYIVFIFIMAFLVTWLLFAIGWWSFVVYAESRPQDTNSTEPIVTSCLDGVDDFSSALLFSIETQQTIGYGTRSVTPNCPLAITIVMIQSLIGVLLSCVMTGLIFAKFSRPKTRAETVLFSKRAVICDRDGERCLVFRVGDMRRTHMASVSIRALLIREYVTQEKEHMPYFQHNLHVQTESDDFFFLAWPIKVIHKIDKTSPLWKMTAEDLLAGDFEIVVIFEGTNQTTGQSTQIRTSYLPSEILWGHRLNNLITSVSENNKYMVDYTRFHDTVPVIMDENSAEMFNNNKSSRLLMEKRLGLK